ncbi:MAG TPA: nuclear transport factor 2 family protein [Pedomonas sp.]|uniref:nuclear transport factor 2 family protein n=1 Tax=Pedomonas sp. TaxID=2976421 RepID=UPI002F40D426
MLSHQELSDRAEIQDLITRYAYAIDDRDWDALDNVFTADAIIDYSEAGGARGTVAEIKEYLAGAMARFPAFQHLSTTTRLQIDGDRAKARTILFNPMVMEHEGQERVFFVGLWYNDELVRTLDGWRIAHRYEQMSWTYNTPPGMMP